MKGIRICVPIMAEKASKIIPSINKAERAGADLIEIRLDYLKNHAGIKKIVKSTSLPLIATNRSYEQGGRRPQNEDKRIKDLLEATELGFHYVDLELTTPSLDFLIQKIKENGVKPIVSFHDFDQTPETNEMEKLIRAQINAGAEICKLVTTANNIVDNLSCLFTTTKLRETTNIVCFAMGQKGTPSRVLSPLFGAYFTYASLRRGLETASGQLPVSDLKKIYEILGVEIGDLWEN